MLQPSATKPVKLIAVYGRVSTARQEEEETIKTQLAAIREFAGKNGYSILKEYVDDGWSGDLLARPALDQLRGDAKKKLWDAVLFYDPDRLARRYSYQELVMDELRELGIEILFVTVSTPKSGEEKILHGVRGLFAEYERVKIAERFRLGKVRKAKEGHVIASEAPYGYTFIRKTKERQGYYEINGAEARVVRMIFSFLVDEKLTIRKIVKRLQELAILPRKSKRRVWSTSTLGTLLRNKTYIGEGHYGSSYAVVPQKPWKTGGYKKIKKTSRKMKPEEEWIKIPTPPLIKTDLFERAQVQLRENSKLSYRNKKNQYLLSGKIHCTCGRTRVGEGPQRGKHLYYRCASRVHSYPLPPTCSEKGINARVADSLVWARVVELMSSKDLMLKQAKRWMESQHKKSRLPEVEIEGVEKEVAKLKIEEDRYARAFGAGLFSIEKFQEYVSAIRDKIASLESQIAKLKVEGEDFNVAVLPQPQEIGAFTERATRTLQDLNFEAKRAIITSVIERVIGTQQQLQVFGNIPVTNHVESKLTIGMERTQSVIGIAYHFRSAFLFLLPVGNAS